MKHEGYLETCLGSSCHASCCEKGYTENLKEFEKSPRGKLKTKLEERGIKFRNYENQIQMYNCMQDNKCVLLKDFSQTQDIRSLACKIFPLKTINISNQPDTIGIYLRACPATQPNFSVSQKFIDSAISLIKKHYKEHSNKSIEVHYIDEGRQLF